MRAALIATALVSTLCSAPLPFATPALAAGPSCLSSGDATEAVTSRRVVRPVQAIGTARRAVPGADVLRAVLCRDPKALVYRITVLRPDGRMVRVTVDAPSGNVLVVH